MSHTADDNAKAIETFQHNGGLHPDAILAQLDRILSNPEFAQSERLQKFLRFIVTETLAGRAETLKEFTIALDVFERDDSFDPQTNSIVRVEASRLRAKLVKYNGIEGRNDPIHIRLPTGHYIPVFENNVTAAKSTEGAWATLSSALKPAFLSKKLVASLLFVMLGVVALQFYSPQSSKQGVSNSSNDAQSVLPSSIAILPLRNLSGSADQDFFSDGITDALITALAKRVSIRVISTRSVLAYKNVDKSVASIAQELDVSHVVEGAILRVENKIRITAQLIAIKNNTHLWAETFEREISDVMALQNDIVEQIATSLALRVAAGNSRIQNLLPKRPQAAFEALLKGRFYRNKMTEIGLKTGLSYFKEAIEIQPDYASAYSGMAACYCILGGHGFEIIHPKEAMLPAKTAALEALNLNNSLAEPHAFLGIIYLKYEWDWKAAESAFRQSIALNPSYAQARLFYSFFLEAMGRKDEAIKEAREARAIDPLSREVNINLGWQLLQAGQLEAARLQFEATAELSPDFWGIYWGLGHYYRRIGNPDASIESFQKSIEVGGGHVLPLSGLGYTLAVSGRRAEALAVVNKLKLLSQNSYVSPVNMSGIYAGLGEKELAFAWLEKAFTDRSRSLAWLKVLPEFNTLRTDKRYKLLLARIGLPE